MLLLYQIAMSLLVGLGPLFILCLLFEQTTSIFQRWLFYGIGTVFSMAVLAAMTGIDTEMVARVTVSTGHRSKKEAERKAVSECAASGASDCRVSMTCFNQCVSWVIPSGRTGNGLSGIGTGPTPGDAERAAQGVCKNDQPGACAPVYANCTEPLFRKY